MTKSALSTKPMPECLVTHWQQQRPWAIAYQYDNQSFTWQDLHQEVSRICHAFTDKGVQPRQVMALIGKNSAELVLMYLACLRLKVTPAMVAPAPDPVIEQKLIQVGANWVWRQTESGSTFEHYATSYQHQASFASLIFTSGSTGAPKAVAHTSQAHMASAQGLIERFEFNSTDSWLLSLPMYHVSGMGIIWRWLSQGACLHLATGDLNADLEKVTHASLVGVQLGRFLEHLKSLRNPEHKANIKLQRVLLGGSHIPQSLILTSTQMGIETWLGYGMTEMASTVTAKSCNALETSGRVLPYRELKIEQSRIFVRGQTLSAGYYKQGVLSSLVENNQWFDTKDLGKWRENSAGEREIVIIGRADNQFISGGENIHCEEIERYLSQYPGVRQALVIPVANKVYGQRPIAFVQANQIAAITDYHDFLSTKLEKYKWPDAVYLIPEDLLATGIKVSRAALKQYYQNVIAEI